MMMSGLSREAGTEGAKGPGIKEFKVKGCAVRLCGKGTVTARMRWV